MCFQIDICIISQLLFLLYSYKHYWKLSHDIKRRFYPVGIRCIQFFRSHGPKGHVSYCHHLASVVVVRRKLLKKSSPLKLLDQLKPNLVWIITRVFSFKIVSDDAVHQPTWPLLLKIEHMGFWVITQKTLIISEIWHGVKIISTARSTYPAILK